MASFKITAVLKHAGSRNPVSKGTFPNRGVRSGTPVASRSIIVFQDDIGGRSAPDGVIVKSLTGDTGFPDTVLFNSRRISSEILSRALRCHMPFIAAAGARPVR
jgi:formate dehydrogenase assembly factor FdhD